jgi:hypothetical protein
MQPGKTPRTIPLYRGMIREGSVEFGQLCGATWCELVPMRIRRYEYPYRRLYFRVAPRSDIKTTRRSCSISARSLAMTMQSFDSFFLHVKQKLSCYQVRHDAKSSSHARQFSVRAS